MIKAHTTHLANGLRVLFLPIPSVRTVELGMYFKAGPRFETPEDNGLSHFSEHMLFRGTRTIKPWDLHLRLETLGGPVVALTGRDHCQYYLALPKRHLPEALCLFSEILLQPTFEGLEIERPIILEERLEDLNDRGDDINPESHSRRLLWGNSPLGQDIIGPRANIERFSVQDLERHQQSTYVAENALLYLSGPVDPDEALPLIERAFGPLPGGEPRTFAATRTETRGPLIHFVDHDASQDTLMLTLGAPSTSHPDYAATQLLYTVLADGMTSRLQWNLCEQRGLVYDLDAHLDCYTDAGALDIFTAAGRGKLPAVLKAVIEILGQLREAEVSPAELLRARERHHITMELGLDSAGATASRLGLLDLYRQDHDLDRALDSIQQVTPAQLQALAQRLFTRTNLVAVMVGQFNKRERRTLADVVEHAWAT